MSLSAGSHLGPYEILSLLGVGGMGEVYRATDTKLKRTNATMSPTLDGRRIVFPIHGAGGTPQLATRLLDCGGPVVSRPG